MKIKGLQKLTLLDYKGYLCATVFTGGCNFTCPFCHNRNLVLFPNAVPTISEAEILHYLKERRGKLEAVCVTGGEPTLQKDLPAFLDKVKSMDYKIKLDTNGTSPSMLKLLIDNGLVDYIAMDIKNSREKYCRTAGLEDIDLTKIEQSVRYLMQRNCNYEFRTTIVRELHTSDDILAICKWIEGADAYYLQAYRENEDVIHPIFSSYSANVLEQFSAAARQYVKKCAIIGI